MGHFKGTGHWEEGNKIVVHWGALGEDGEVQEVSADRQGRRAVTRDEAERREEGYAEITEEEASTLIIQFKVVGWGSVADLDKREKVENLMNERLGWTGLGHCDGGDIGSGTINVFCMVVDPRLALQVALKALEEHDCLEGAVLALEADEDIEVMWPEAFSGEFSY